MSELGQLIIEPAGNRQPAQSQPEFDASVTDESIRQAIANAEANNQDPLTLTNLDVAQVSVPLPAQAAPVEVPQKFLKPDGVVDVEKIQASTKQLDEAIAKKEEAVRTVDDYMRDYNESQKKFHSLPNAEKTLAQIPQNLPPAQPPQQFEDIVRRDYQQDPLMTTTRLIEIALAQRFAPIEQQQKTESVRSNIQELATKDARILRPDVFEAIKAKIASDPDISSRKNPYKAAWLEVKEDMRLGEPSPAPAQPSRLSPVLGGGTPPSTPSASVPSSPQNIAANLNSLDIRDRKQEAMGDEAIRKLLEGHRG